MSITFITKYYVYLYTFKLKTSQSRIKYKIDYKTDGVDTLYNNIFNGTFRGL